MTTKEFEYTKVYCPSRQVVCRNIADETILVPISGNLANMERIFTLNEVGASIWRLMDGTRSMQEILSELTQEFDVAEDQLSGDIAEFVEQLQLSNLIVEQSI